MFFKQSIFSLLVLCRSLSRFQCGNPKMDHDQTNTRRARMHSIYRTSDPASTLCSEPTPCRPCNRWPFISILRVLFYCLHFLHCHVMSGVLPSCADVLWLRVPRYVPTHGSFIVMPAAAAAMACSD